MKRTFKSYRLTDPEIFKTRLLNFGKKFSNFCFLQNNDYPASGRFDVLAAAGSVTDIYTLEDPHLSLAPSDWIFGHVNYDYKNELENLRTTSADLIGFPIVHFFIPEYVFIFSGNEVQIGSTNGRHDEVYKVVIACSNVGNNIEMPSWQSRLSEMEYIDTVRKLQQHIGCGDCYEICLCQEFFAEQITIDPAATFIKLNDLSPNPFAAFYKNDDKYLVCASPERFLQKKADEIISQPIKGTAKRRHGSEEELQIQQFLSDEKERAENIMIVDLVRNDLSKICLEGSVHVKELLGIYSFPQVHQLISTVAGKLPAQISLLEIFQACFPMGSMTGAPKISAMKLIDTYEQTARGLYSGTVGYIDPDGNFDFNVIIRSILYNESKRYVSVQAGSAITAKSVPELELEECYIKIAAMKAAVTPP